MQIFGGGGIGMKKKILIALVLVLCVSSTIVSLVFWRLFLNQEIESERYTGVTVNKQIIDNINASEIKDEKAKELFEDDYRNRLHFAEFLIDSDTDGHISNSEWKNILDLLEVLNINIVDANGTIVQSSKPKNIGQNFYNNEKFSEFIPLLENREASDFHANYDGVSSATDTNNVMYAGIKHKKTGGIIQIEIDPDLLEQYKSMSSISSYVASIPTKSYRTIFVMNSTNAEILGITTNNEQVLEMEKPIETLRSLVGKPGIVKINGKSQFAIIDEYEDKFIGTLVKVDDLKENVKNYMVKFIGYIFFLSVMIILLIYILIDKLVLTDIDRINKRLVNFVEGRTDIKFIPEAKRTEELSLLADNLNKVIGVISSKGERITSIANMLGEGFESYEYYADINQIYFSENLPKLMGVTSEEVEDRVRRKFEEGKERLNGKESVEAIEILKCKSGRIIKVRRVVFENLSYAFFEDITDSVERETNLSENLKIEKEKSYVDHLTGLYNRKKIQEEVEKFCVENKEPNGVMVIMDLDNFKLVNDKAGHQTGDILLQEFANLIKRQFRDSDIKARLGGDEFVIFMPNYFKKEIINAKIENFLDVVRRELSEYYVKYKLSVSVGIAYMGPECDNFEDLYKCADAAMYVAKRHGKDGFYINVENNMCMKSECNNCKVNCTRRTLLFGEE